MGGIHRPWEIWTAGFVKTRTNVALVGKARQALTPSAVSLLLIFSNPL